MEEHIMVKSNDVIAIIVSRTDKKNGMYDVIPTDVAIGQVDENNFFHSEDKLYLAAELCSDFIEDDNINEYYIKPISIQELRLKYPDIKDLTNLLSAYYNEVASKFFIVGKKEDSYKLFTVPYSVIDKSLNNNLNKDEKELPSTQLIINNESECPVPIEVDIPEFDRYLKARILENDDILEDIETTICTNLLAKDPSQIQTMLSMGCTGTGKTATYKAIAEYLNIPLLIYDCTSLTAAGYKGNGIDDVLRDLYKECKDGFRTAKRGIIMLDEFDKIASHGTEVNDIGVQRTLLKLLDGHKYTFQLEPNHGKTCQIDTSFLTIAACGAFEDLLEKKYNPRSLGFQSEMVRKSSIEITKKELERYGYLREIVGRINNLYIYKSLDANGLKNIIVNSVNSPLTTKINTCLEQFGCEVVYDEDFLDAFVEYTIGLGTGGRSIKDSVNTIFKKIDRELLQHHGEGKKLVLKPDIVYDNRSFEL